jgi:hypothetical protein
VGSKQIDLKEVPGIELIQARLAAIDPGLSVSDAGYDFDRTQYVLELRGQAKPKRGHRPATRRGASAAADSWNAQAKARDSVTEKLNVFSSDERIPFLSVILRRRLEDSSM